MKVRVKMGARIRAIVESKVKLTMKCERGEGEGLETEWSRPAL